jgi:hypothetical protein
MDPVTSNHLKRGVYGLSLLLLLSLLSGCQAASNDLAGATEEIASVAKTQPAPTAPLTAIPTDSSTAVPTDSSTIVPTDSPTTIPTDSPDATAIDTDEAAIMNGGEQEANADVEFVRAVQNADGSWTFHVSVRHPDTGWEDYADGWDVVLADGSVLKRGAGDPFTRLLLHPHESEQPFTRSQSGLVIPEDARQVIVRAHDLVDGFGGRQVIVDLNVSAGPDFEVERQ